MKKYALILSISLIIGFWGNLSAQNRFWIATTTSDWNNTANWSATSGGPGGASVPGPAEVAVFNANGSGNCNLDIPPTVGGITINGYTGTIDFQGNNLTTTGVNQFTTGTLVPGTSASLILNTLANTTFNGTVVSVDVSGTTGRIHLNGSTFNGTVNITKTDANNDNSAGGNTFNGSVTLTNAGNGQILLGNVNRDQFNGVTTFNNNGGYRFYVAHNHGGQTTTFANDLILNTNKSGGTDGWSYFICEGSNTAVSFGGNVTINCAGSLQSNHRILQGAGSQATYSGTVTVNLTNTHASTSITIGANGTSVFNDNIIVNNSGGANGIYFNNSATSSSTLAATKTISIGGSGFTAGNLSLARFTQTDATDQTLTALSGTSALLIGPNSDFGGNVNFSAPNIYLHGATYRGTATLEKTGATDNYSNGGNVFQSAATITNSGSGEIFLGNGNADTFNGVTTFNNTGSYRIRIAHNHNGQTTTFNGPVTLNTNKTGGTDTWSFLVAENLNSHVTFEDALTINVMGSLRSDVRFLFGSGSIGTFNGPVTIHETNTHASTIVTMGVNGTAAYAENIIINNPGGTNGVVFNNNGLSSSTLAAGKTITIGGGGFASGVLGLLRFTQTGATPQTLTALSGTSTLVLGPNSKFEGDVNFSAPRLLLNTVTFEGTTVLEKKGTGDDAGTGGNIFNGTTTLINSGSGYFLSANNSPDIFNADVTITNSGSNYIYLAHNVPGNEFNGNIVVNNIGSALGIRFSNNAAGASTFNAGTTKTISIGASGFTTGELGLKRFSAIGTAPQALLITGTAALIVGPNSRFDGDVNFSSPRLLLNGCVYGGAGTFEKTGDLDDAGTGGNIFTGVTTITNSGLRYLLLGNGSRDQFLSAATFNNTGSFRIYFAHNHAGQTTEFASDLTLNSNKSGGSDSWSYLVAENNASGISVGGTLTINCAGAIQSSHRFLNGTGSTGSFNSVVINMINTHPSTFITMGENGTSEYSGDISVTNSGGAGGITFNQNSAASSTLNGSISCGTFSSGQLNLYRFTQLGIIPQSLSLTTPGTLLRIGPGSSFDGSVTFIAPRLLLHGAVYNGAAFLEKTSTTDDNSQGGNIFNGPTTIINSGSGYLLLANNFPDVFNEDLTVTNSGSNFIYLAYNSAGNEFNGNIILNNTGSASGIRFSNSAGGSATFNAGTDKTISIGSSGFSVGELGLKRFTQTGSSAQTLTLTGSATLLILGPVSEFNGNVTFTSPRILLHGTRYNGTAYLEKTSTTNDDGIGGNTFMQAATLVNSGSSYLLTGATNPDVFNGVLTLNNNGSSTIRLADNSAGNEFNDDIQLNSTSGGGIFFGNNVNGTSTLAAGKTIGVGSSGFITGDVRLIRFTQVGPTPQTLNLGGIAILTLGPSSSFGGDVDFRSPQLLMHGTTFNGTSYLEKKGAGDNYSNGGNTFVGSSTIVNSGSGYLAMALNSPDVFQSDLTATNTGSNVLYLANNVTGNVFNGNITFNSTLGSGGIYISNNATASATLGNGASLLTGALGFSSGELRLKRLTQIGNSAQTLTLTGTALLRIGPSSTFNGNLNFQAPQMALDGAVYNGITYLEKTGASNNDSGGGNSFLGATTTIANSGSGYFRFAVAALDIFGSGDLILNNTGTSTIRMADNVPGSIFNGNIFVNSTFGGGIYFSESGGGTATLSAGKLISVGGLGFTTGELRIRRFTQSDATTPQTLLLTGTSSLVLGPIIAFSGNTDFRAPQVYMNGGTFNGPALIEKTGATDNTGTGGMTFQSTTTLRLSGSGYFRTNGGNVFNGATSIINTGSNYMLFELTTGSTYNGDLTLINTGSSNIRMAYTGTSAFNGNILVNSTSGAGIYFVESGTGSATLASGKTIAVGADGFTAGELRIQRFTQTGTTAQNIALTGTATLRSGPSTTWNGDFTASSPAILLDGTTFNGTTNSITKTGTTTDNSTGGNTFGAGTTSTLTNSGSGTFRLASTTADNFGGNVIFNQAAGLIQPAYNIASTFQGDVTITSSSAITFGAASGGITFTGTANQLVHKGGTASPVFRRLVINKPSGTVTLNTDATVSLSATFTSGIINTTAVNYLNFADNATASGANNSSFVDGPVRKTGNDAFTFPIGANSFYRPAGISAPTGTAHYFIAQYFNTDHGLGSAGDPSFTSVSKCEYWTIERNAGATSNVVVELSWQETACVPGYITNPATLRVARWNGASWVDHGNGGTTGTATNGTISTSSAVTSFSPFTLASASLANPLPVELTRFKASITKNGTGLLEWHTESELNNDRFEIERSENGVNFTYLGSVEGAGSSNKPHDYQFEDSDPIPGLVYYRLKQVDFDGKAEYSRIVSLDYAGVENGPGHLTISPNPISSGSFASFRSGNRITLQTVTIFNNVNQVVRQYSDVEGFNTEGLPSGIYIVKNKSGEIFRLVIR